MPKRSAKKLYEETKKRLFQKRPLGWDQLRGREEEVFSYAEGYRKFISEVKTERECAAFVIKRAEEAGFVFADKAGPQDSRLFFTNRGKAVALVARGERGLSSLKLIASHIDSPRLDLKPNPLYEELDLAYLKTHYYGGIKKFQWVARPLAIHGVVAKADGRKIEICLGEDEGPVFCVNDLLPHLARKAQGEKKLSEAIPAEKLNVLFAGLPFPAEEGLGERIKLAVLKILSDRFGLVEEDFVSADLEVVPAGPARDVGLDGAFVGGYGQDDRICAYTSLTALLEAQRLPETAVLLFLDREEIGSDGNTGAKSRFLELVLSRMLRLWTDALEADRILELFFRTRAISADVTAGLDPDWPEVHEKRNDAKVGRGVAISKYTGHGGKYGASEAHAEYMGWLRGVLNKAGVVWQAVDFGKTDEGGGGTVAKYLAFQGLDIVDMGPPLLSMHSPFEICHKADLFETYRAYRSFLEAE
ncbi:aminopeptidase [Thermosulfuriphilus sp.]